MEPGTCEVWWASTAWISHSGATVAVAVSDAGAVGVDVRQVTDDAVGELSPLVLADSEAGHVTGARDLFTYRARKEALVKATGDGVGVPLGEVVVTPPGRRRACSAPRDRAGWPRSCATSTPSLATSAPWPCSAPGRSSSRSGPGSGC
jgi:phosphopantetheinyl transferase